MNCIMQESNKLNVVDIKTPIKFKITASSDVSGELILKEGVPIYVPLFSSTVHAGFESPASDHVEEWFNPTDYLIDKKYNTKTYRVNGDCMTKSEIFHNDIVIVNTALEAKVGNIVVVAIDDGFIIRILGKHCLIPNSHNPAYQPIQFKEMQDIHLVGVVTGLMKRFKV